jgi:hypothetical protein
MGYTWIVAYRIPLDIFRYDIQYLFLKFDSALLSPSKIRLNKKHLLGSLLFNDFPVPVFSKAWKVHHFWYFCFVNFFSQWFSQCTTNCTIQDLEDAQLGEPGGLKNMFSVWNLHEIAIKGISISNYHPIYISEISWIYMSCGSPHFLFTP